MSKTFDEMMQDPQRQPMSQRVKDPVHLCMGVLRSRLYGPAFDFCVQDAAGRFWIGDSGRREYESQVQFCPYCGAKAPVQEPALDEGEIR